MSKRPRESGGAAVGALNATLQGVLNAAYDAAITVDVAWQIVFCNQPARELLDGAEDPTGQPLAAFVASGTLDEALPRDVLEFATSHDELAGRVIPLTLARCDGRRLEVDLSMAYVAGDRGPWLTLFLRERPQGAGHRPLAFSAPTAGDECGPLAASSWLRTTVELCLRSVCGWTGWPAGHVLVPDRSRHQLVSADIWHTHATRDVAAWRAARSTMAFDEGEGVPGLAWRTGEPSWGSDGSSASRDAPMKSTFALPVNCDGQLVAVLEFVHRESLPVDPRLMALGACVGTLLSQIIEESRWGADRARLAEIVDSADDAIISTDALGIIQSWNAGAERLYGYPQREAIGQSLAIIVPPDRRDQAPVLDTVLHKGRRLIQQETVRRRSDGRQIDVSLTAAPVFDRNGRVTGASIIERDITRRKRHEAERARAQAAAESANRAKSEFLANVSHELRTPMNAILGMLELSLDDDLSAIVHDYLATAHDSAQLLLLLLNDLLDFSRAEAGTLELDSAVFSLRQAVTQAMKILSIRAHEKGLELVCNVRDEVPDRLDGDARRLQQVVMNLVGNAIKFTDSGEVAVEVTLAGQQRGSVELLLTVSDTGIGISPADQEKIFAPFTQADASSTRKYSGTGLGLTITAELARRMNGRLWVESKLGQGSRFLCTMRLERAAAGDPSAEQELLPDNARGAKVLVVDPSRTSRKVLDTMLRRWSLHPTLCASGVRASEALRRAAAVPFPLVIVDALLPDVDGLTFIETAEHEGILRGATIVMVSPGSPPSFLERCEKLGINAQLAKPVSQEDLLRAIRIAFERQHSERWGRRILPAAGRPLRVLVAEDTRANQKVVKAILAKRGHMVEVVDNGREALDRVQKANFDVVLMDAQMPMMNGLQATAAIRQMADADRATVPVIAMTAHALREDRDRCLAAGMDDYLSKPIDAAELIRRVELHAARHAGEAAVQAPGETGTPGDGRIVDLRAARARFGSLRLLREMIAMFRNGAPNLIGAVRSALADHDSQALARAAHNLRGVAVNFDADATVAAATNVEHAADSGDLEAAAKSLERLEVEFSHLLEALGRADRRRS